VEDGWMRDVVATPRSGLWCTKVVVSNRRDVVDRRRPCTFAKAWPDPRGSKPFLRWIGQTSCEALPQIFRCDYFFVV
jgi:hypothetical protein